jgi:hypothetical protein
MKVEEGASCTRTKGLGYSRGRWKRLNRVDKRKRL